jgi:hypothetical protein
LHRLSVPRTKRHSGRKTQRAESRGGAAIQFAETKTRRDFGLQAMPLPAHAGVIAAYLSSLAQRAESLDHRPPGCRDRLPARAADERRGGEDGPARAARCRSWYAVVISEWQEHWRETLGRFVDEQTSTASKAYGQAHSHAVPPATAQPLSSAENRRPLSLAKSRQPMLSAF